jgi:hypothetical protein
MSHNQYFHHKKGILHDLPLTGHHLLLHSYHVTQKFLNHLMMESGKMSNQAVLIHCPSSASVVLLWFLLVLVGSIPHTNDVVNIWIVSYMTHQEAAPEGLCLLAWSLDLLLDQISGFSVRWPWKHTKLPLLFYSEEHLFFCARLLSAT